MSVLDKIANGALDGVFGHYGPRIPGEDSTLSEMHDGPSNTFTYGPIKVLVVPSDKTFSIYHTKGGTILDCHRAPMHGWFRSYHYVRLESMSNWGSVFEVSNLDRTGADECILRWCNVCGSKIHDPRARCKLGCANRLFTHSWIGATLRKLRSAGIERVRIMDFDPFLSEEDRMAYSGEWA